MFILQRAAGNPDQIVITRSENPGYPSYPLQPCTLTLDKTGKCRQHILFRPTEEFQLISGTKCFDISQFCDLLRELSDTRYSFCSGIPANGTEQSTSIKVFTWPVERYQSKKCQVWYKRTMSGKADNQTQCLHCKYTTYYLARRNNRIATPTKKVRHSLIQSNYSISKLTPSSKRRRLQKVARARHTLKVRVKKLEHRLKEKDMLLNKTQSEEMRDIVNNINTDFQDDLQAVLNSNKNNDDALKKCWEADSQKRQIQDIKDFYGDQGKNEFQNRGNKWSTITYRIALAVYTRSPSAYRALQGFEILKLPCVRQLQEKTSKYLDPAGINQDYLEEQAHKYAEYKKEKMKKGEPIPQNTGVLIFDEVKVIDKLVWNSKNHEFVGLAMTPEDFPYLHDIMLGTSATSDSPNAARYIVQFLWRDLTSDFDLMGPYFTCEKSLEHKFLLGCVLETIRALEAFKFGVKCLVCDGASENLALIKTTMGMKGVFGYKTDVDGTYDFKIRPSFPNPYNVLSNIHWIICPSHQLKNMVSALHASRDGGPKHFERQGKSFGWENLKDMKNREDERFLSGQIRYEPKLMDSYIARDSWTRLNVKPSKVMQQEGVLGELYDYAHSNARDAYSAMLCHDYLRALNRLFEHGFLSKTCVKSMDAKPVENIQEGYKYFTDWFEETLLRDPNFNPNKNTQKSFLSWQTWDLLRVCVYGVQGLVIDFVNEFPNHFLVLSRINGSAVETLFSQLKYAAGSKLSSVNYHTARKALLTKSNVHTIKTSNQGYRNVPLYMRETAL